VEQDRGVVWLTLAAGAGRGRLTPELDAELVRVAAEIDLDDSARVVVLASSGRSFGEGLAVAPLSRGLDGVAAIGSIRQPVIALIAGDALDSGCELALACDLRVASRVARIGLTQASRGVLPCRGGTQRLPRIVGAARALHMLLLGEVLPASRALSLGLLDRVAPVSRLKEVGKLLALSLAERGPIALRLAKEALRAAQDLPLAEGLRLEGDLYVLLQTTRDRDEGIASFHAKRAPRFSGR